MATSREGDRQMRIAELSASSGVPVATIKYYVREGLLEPGERSSPNQVVYGDAHVRRLRLVRALVDIGGLSIAAARDVLAEVETPGRDTHGLLGVVHRSVLGGRTHARNEHWESAAGEIDALAAQRGWRLRPGNPARSTAVEVLATMRQLGHDHRGELLDHYAEAVEQIAAAELAMTAQRAEHDSDSLLERTVIGIVLGGTLIGALRGMAQEDASARRFDPRLADGSTASASPPTSPRK